MFYPIFLLFISILGVFSAQAATIISNDQLTYNLMLSSASFYAAESSIEDSLYEFKKNKNSNSLIKSFQLESADLSQKSYVYNYGNYDIDIVDRRFNGRPQPLDPEGRSGNFDEFRFFDIEPSNYFNDLKLYYLKRDNAKNEFSKKGILIDVIAFPRIHFDGKYSEKLNFGSIKQLSYGSPAKKKYYQAKGKLLGDAGVNVKRMMFNSQARNSKGEMHNKFGSIEIQNSTGNEEFMSAISIKNLDVASYNYIVRFQNLDRNIISYELFAYYGDFEVGIPANQVIEIDSQTEIRSMYQRVRVKQRSFAPLQPGLGFALFSDSKISK